MIMQIHRYLVVNLGVNMEDHGIDDCFSSLLFFRSSLPLNMEDHDINYSLED